CGHRLHDFCTNVPCRLRSRDVRLAFASVNCAPVHLLLAQLGSLSLPLPRRVEGRWLTAGALTAAGAILAFDPLLWLMHTWHARASASRGLLVAAAGAFLAIWSASSELIAARLWRAHMAFRLLALSALVRLVGQVGAINVLGALTL